MREVAQHVMSALVKKAGRNIAPYLKNMMGAWLLNQCDTYPTVASAAQSAFTNSFSPHKQKNVWSFSKDTIIEVHETFYKLSLVMRKTCLMPYVNNKDAD